jgi:hypothetical protein
MLQLLDSSSELFTCGSKRMENERVLAKQAELFQQIGRLHMELERLKKISPALTHMTCANRSITTTLSSLSAGCAFCWGFLD